MLNGYYTSIYYPKKMLKIKFKNAETGKVLIFLTNNFNNPAVEIAMLYKYRWGIELLF